MAQIPFTVSARAAKLIGQENFANAEGAVVELVKNAYDADSQNCIIIFDKNNGVTDIYIIDNGKGMTAEDIETKWMTIGTDDKLLKHSSDSGRIKTGAKGIGRFALDRLGPHSEMITRSAETNQASIWTVNWKDFERAGAAIHNIHATIETNANLDIKLEILNRFGKYPRIHELLDTVAFDSGTILKISPARDTWDDEAIERLFENLEVLTPPKEQPDFRIHLFASSRLGEFGEVSSAFYDDYDYRLKANFTASQQRLLTVEVRRNELSIERLEDSYLEVFQNKRMQEHPFTLEAFKNGTFTVKIDLDQLSGFNNDLALLGKIGDFEFTFYFLKQGINEEGDGDLKTYPYRPFSTANRKAWLRKFSGVKIFRDGFRVRPYGESGQDWLRLGDRKAKSPASVGRRIGGYRIGPNQIAGTVKISRLANPCFQDKSGREGIQENDAFELFKNLLLEVISVFEKDRNTIMNCLSELASERNQSAAERKQAEDIANEILDQPEGNTDTAIAVEGTSKKSESRAKHTDTEKLLAKATKHYKHEIDEKNEEIRSLRGLASIGLIISSFAHEVKSLRARLEPRTEHLEKELKKYISINQLKAVNTQENPFYMLSLIRNEDLKLKQWLDYSLNSLKRDKRKRTDINIANYFKAFKATWEQALRQRKVELNLIGMKYPPLVVKAFEVDLDSIFNNLLSNSLSAFKEKKGNYSRVITIDWILEESSVVIIFKDNGCGLSQEYRNNPYKIFEYNESSKRDRKGSQIGTGMGLYIVQLVIEDYKDATVEILETSNGFAVGIKLKLKK